MNYLLGLRCLRCGAEYPPTKMFCGCPKCKGEWAANLTPTYDHDEIRRVFKKELLSERPPTLWRYREFLPVGEEHIVSISEGMTPLIQCPSLGAWAGLDNLYIKDESRNPSWSFKDRAVSVAVSKAVEFGAKTVTVSSSGNMGASAGAYASRAGLNCVVFTTEQFPRTMRTFMQAYGAKVVAVPTKRDRFRLMGECVDALEWFPLGNYVYPIIGGNAYGVEGNKTIAYEICEQLGWRTPDKVVIPVSHGDALWGMWKGFNEFHDLGYIRSLPQMIAAQAFRPLKNALDERLDYVEEVPSGPYTVAPSVGGGMSTYQALKTLRDSGGMAETATNEQILETQAELAKREGIYGEASSVLALAVVKKLRAQGRIGQEETAVALLTSGGLKDPEVTRGYLPSIPLIEPTMEALRAALRTVYGYETS